MAPRSLPSVPGRRRTGETSKSIFDPVHGVISLSGPALEVIGRPEFQRLWGIRQTGFAHLVFPGANHTRLEHSLGVAHVAEAMGKALDLPVAAREEVTVGGLLHDLGHGPFSHTLEPTMQEVFGHGHERLSRDRIVAKEPPAGADVLPMSEFLSDRGVAPERVASLVDPPARRTLPDVRTAILHGAIDADRIDYLQRDAHYTGVAHGAIDAVRLLATVRSVRGRLAFAAKGRSAIEGFLVGRSLMYASVYYHKTVRAAEVMAQAALERMAGYPATAVELLSGTDGEFLHALKNAGGRSAELGRALEERRLFKRVVVRNAGGPSDRARLHRLARDPAARRALEDRLAELAGLPAASVLLDLSGLEARGLANDWHEVALEDDGRLEFPFRGPGPWAPLVQRPPSPWAVSVYVDPRHRRAEVARPLARALGGG